MAKPNYRFEKRQRDLAKKRKQEEKRQRKLAAKLPADNGSPDPSVERPEPTKPDDPGAV
ncbi:MAG: hypothetical protein HYU76_01555 [Betaproteobacteria bacterium]|nr:hypothetical protein [Betaproteobacteria bacterium]